MASIKVKKESLKKRNIKANKMVETSKGVYEISLLLKPGEYEYKFNEDGMFYITDQNAKDFADDGFGGKNSVLVVDDSFDKVTIKKGDGILRLSGNVNIVYGHYVVRSDFLMAKTKSANSSEVKGPEASIPSPPALTVWLSVPIIIPPGKA